MKTVGEIIGNRVPYSVEPELSVREVVDYLYAKGIGAIAVCEGGKVVGVFSERDLMRRVVAKGLDPANVKVRDVMTKDVFFVRSEESYHIAQALMLDKNFRHLVVLDGDHQLQGFVSMRELLEVDLEESKKLIRRLNDDYYDHRFKPGE